jgi:hypothetical protein
VYKDQFNNWHLRLKISITKLLKASRMFAGVKQVTMCADMFPSIAVRLASLDSLATHTFTSRH